MKKSLVSRVLILSLFVTNSTFPVDPFSVAYFLGTHWTWIAGAVAVSYLKLRDNVLWRETRANGESIRRVEDKVDRIGVEVKAGQQEIRQEQVRQGAEQHRQGEVQSDHSRKLAEVRSEQGVLTKAVEAGFQDLQSNSQQLMQKTEKLGSDLYDFRQEFREDSESLKVGQGDILCRLAEYLTEQQFKEYMEQFGLQHTDAQKCLSNSVNSRFSALEIRLQPLIVLANNIRESELANGQPEGYSSAPTNVLISLISNTQREGGLDSSASLVSVSSCSVMEDVE